MGSRGGRLLWIALLLAVLAPAARGQDTSEKPAAQAKPAAPSPSDYTYIVGGDVWTVTNGVVRNGTVVMLGGKIDAIGGADMKPPAGAKIVDAKGKVVTPGFVTDGASLGGGGVQPGGQLRDSLDPYSLSVSLAAASGITTVYLSAAGAGRGRGRGGGGGGRFGGQAAQEGSFGTNNIVIKMVDGELADMVAAESTVTTLSLESPRGFGGFGRAFGANLQGPPGDMSARWTIQDQLRRAKAYLDKLNQSEADKKAGKTTTAPVKPADADAVLPLLKQERLLRVAANTVADIRFALKLANEYGIKMVISPAGEGWIVANELAASKTMVIITARDRTLPDERKNGFSGANPDGPGILERAGVHFAVLPPDTSFSIGGELGRDMMTFALEGSYAMRGGADEQWALEALTITAAKAIGMDTRVGSLEKGKDADVLILSGDPLDYRSFVEKTYINGKLCYDKSKSTFFKDIVPASER